MTPCHSHIDLLLTLNSRSSGGPKTKYRKIQLLQSSPFFPNKMYSVRKSMAIHHRRKSTVSLAHAHWPWTNQLNFSPFHEYLHFNSPCNKTTKRFGIWKYENEDHVMKKMNACTSIDEIC